MIFVDILGEKKTESRLLKDPQHLYLGSDATVSARHLDPGHLRRGGASSPSHAAVKHLPQGRSRSGSTHYWRVS